MASDNDDFQRALDDSLAHDEIQMLKRASIRREQAGAFADEPQSEILSKIIGETSNVVWKTREELEETYLELTSEESEYERLHKAAQRVVDAFEAMGRADGAAEVLLRRTECERALTLLKAEITEF